MSGSSVWYYQGAERPALRLWLQDDDGELIDFSSGWTFEFKIGRTGSAALLTKTAGVVGAAGAGSQALGTPNVVVTWASGELNLPVGFYDWQLTATSGGLQRVFGGTIKILSVISPGTLSPVPPAIPGLVENDQAAATSNRLAVQAALDTAAAVGAVRPAFTGAGGKGGGIVRLPVGFYYFDKAPTGNRVLTLPHAVELAGSGWGTVLALADGQASAASPCTVIKVADGAAGSVISDLRIFGNRANQTDTNHQSHGIDLNRAAPPLELYDGHLAVRDVLVFGCEGDGVRADGTADTAALRNVSAYHNYRGFNARTDQTWTGCVAGNNDTDGFRLYAGTGTRFSGCKAFGGQVGWSISYSKMIQLAACLAEDTAIYGWDLTALTDTTLASCGAYRSVSGSSARAALVLKDDGAGTLPERVSITGFAALGEIGSGNIVEFNQAFRLGQVGVGCTLHATAAGYAILIDDMTGGANPAVGDMGVVINGTSLGVSPYP